MNGGYQVEKKSNAETPNAFVEIINESLINDISDVSGKTPFDDLLTKEESEMLGGDDQQMKNDITAALLFFLFKPTKGFVPSPKEVALRCFMLAYSINPMLIGSLTMHQIGELFDTSRQTISSRIVKNNRSLNLRSRAQKSDLACQKYSDLGKDRWELKKEQERKEYLKRYREENRERLREKNAEYYQENKEAILAKRKT